MSSTLIARKDFEDAVRSKLVWAVMGVFLFLMALVAVSASTQDLSEVEPTQLIVTVTNIGGLLFIPIVSLIVGYMAIVGERQSGSLRVLFGLSHSRWDVFVGKFVSRLGVVFVATLLTVALTVGMAVAMFDSVPLGTYLGYSALTILLGLAFAAIAVGVSAVSTSRMQAMGGAIGSYVVFSLIWHPLVAGVHYLLEGSMPELEAPEWYFLLLRLNPLDAYRQVSSELAGEFIWGIIGMESIVEDIPDAAFENPDTLLLSNRVSGDLPFYLSDWFAAVVLLAWIVVPLAIGYWRFDGADLN
ncbi:ABC transporter permease [Haloterrigena sp. SYSU A558-1]|uniref:ABC transporter permease n=1 Tax=Haloterrigena gelatinilytica TaxID=2741724 RepID=A0ABX2LDZ9_9EURY|nr:ABC transporter permease [Haloterrigena gelatinilytica]NUC73655.1 ABC transporter permease [Haloterrigena gelatinilytica]